MIKKRHKWAKIVRIIIVYAASGQSKIIIHFVVAFMCKCKTVFFQMYIGGFGGSKKRTKNCDQRSSTNFLNQPINRSVARWYLCLFPCMLINYAVRESALLDFPPSVAKTLSYPPKYCRCVCVFDLRLGWATVSMRCQSLVCSPNDILSIP